MGDKKLSSVEWLVEQLRKNEFIDDPTELIDEAKAMHREEVMEAYRYSRAHWSKEDGNPEQYFTKIFGGQNNE